MKEKIKSLRNILTLLIIGTGGLVLGYYSLQGHLLNKIFSIFPFGTALACFIAIFLPDKKKDNKKIVQKSNKVSKKNFFYDLRIYYVIALILILIYPPMNYHEFKSNYFDGWYPISYLGEEFSINITYLAIEFIFITIVFMLFKKR